MNEAGPPNGHHASDGTARRRRRLWLAAVALFGLALVAGLVGVFIWERQSQAPVLVAEADLTSRWGTYVSEREWGTPREAVGTDGWGLSWRGAIDTEYHYSDDGIGGITDVDNEFRLGWAFWDGQAEHVTERFYGVTNPQGDSGEAIVDDRVLHENTPHHAYARLVYDYPTDSHAFEVQLEMAKLDSTTMVLSASVTNTTPATRSLHLVLKASTVASDDVEPIDGGFLLKGAATDVAVVADPADAWQISNAKDALDNNLRGSGLSGDDGGTLGALDFNLQIAGEASRTVHVAITEVALADGASAGGIGRSTLGQSTPIIAARRADARAQFGGQVSAHDELYRQSLMSLLWNESYYRWDGTTGVNTAWAGKVDAHDIVIVPDKWEYPWLASWDSGFHAVTATLIDPTLAADQMRFLFSDRWQQPDGHVPCGEWVMDQECPPIFAWVTWQIYEANHDLKFLQEMYPRLQAQYEYWWQKNQVGDALFGGGFMGMDNLPRGGGAQADSSSWMAFFARDMVRIASELRDTTASERYWADRGRIQTAINDNLWDDATGFYYDLRSDGTFVHDKSYTGLVPLIAGVVPAERIPIVLSALRDPRQFLSPGGIRSMSAASPDYIAGEAGKGANSNWRGPVWMPINYLLIQGITDLDPPFADELRTRLVDNIEQDWQQTGRLHEYFDGDTGTGLGADDQAGWTALVANLIKEGWPASP